MSRNNISKNRFEHAHIGVRKSFVPASAKHGCPRQVTSGSEKERNIGRVLGDIGRTKGLGIKPKPKMKAKRKKMNLKIPKTTQRVLKETKPARNAMH